VSSNLCVSIPITNRNTNTRIVSSSLIDNDDSNPVRDDEMSGEADTGNDDDHKKQDDSTGKEDEQEEAINKGE
jgi:hypothetical protein